MNPSHHAVVMLFLFALGLCVGSFMNVCIYRIPAGLGVVRPRSRCPKCASAIRPSDNIPVLSWLLLGGKCRECRCEISPRYAIVELMIGVLFAVVYIIQAALSPVDLWETAGFLGVIALIIACCLPIGLLIAIVLIRHDRRAGGRSLPIGHGIGG
jgi:leader peptidase (prepilin peptidase) / N-methyltransferase